MALFLSLSIKEKNDMKPKVILNAILTYACNTPIE